MKIFKIDGLIRTDPRHIRYFDGLDASFVEQPLLTEEEIITKAHDAEALLALREPITERVISNLKNLKVIGRFGVGLDSIDVEAATRAGVQVTYAPGCNIDEVSTHAMGMLLALSRRLKRFDASVRRGEWDAMRIGAGIQRGDRQVLGLIGFGQIGRLTARKAAPFGYRMLAYDPHLSDARIEAGGATSASFDKVLTEADILSLHIPATPETRNIIDAEALARMKKGAILINVSRGGLVDEAALAQFIRSGHIAGAGIDTLAYEPPAADNPLLGLDEVILSPHAAHYSEQSYEEVRSRVFADVAAVLRGERPQYPVNFRDERLPG